MRSPTAKGLWDAILVRMGTHPYKPFDEELFGALVGKSSMWQGKMLYLSSKSNIITARGSPPN